MKKIFIILCLFIISLVLSSCKNNLNWDDFAGGYQIILNIDETNKNGNDIKNLNEIKNIITQRLESFHVKNYIVKVINNNIIVQIANYDQLDRIIFLITQKAKLEFRVVVTPPMDDFFKAEKFYFKSSDSSLYLKKESIITNEDINNVDALISAGTNMPYLQMEFDSDGSKKFAKITSEYINYRLAIVMDNKIYSAPVIREKITGGKVMVNENFSLVEAVNLSILLKHGAFPKNVNLLKVEKLDYKNWLGKNNNNT